MVFGDGHAAIAEPLDELGLRDHVGIEPVAAIAGVGIIGGKEVIEFHQRIYRVALTTVQLNCMVSEISLS